MSEDDRAAKAARAKAMLKKRQQKKVASDPPSRVLTPAPAVEDEKQSIGDVFANDDPTDTSWINGLARVPSPNPAEPLVPTESNDELETLRAESNSLRQQLQQLKDVSIELESAKKILSEDLARAISARNQTADELGGKLKKLEADNIVALQNEQRTVALLVSEKASLATEIERLHDVESTCREANDSLARQMTLGDSLEKRLRELTIELETKERELTDKSRDQDLQLQRATSTINSLRKDAYTHQQKVRELEEHIQSDDRAERSEQRADDLEFQLSKLKQAHALLKTERDALNTEMQSVRSRDTEWTAERDALLARQTIIEQRVESLIAEKQAMAEKESVLQAKLAQEEEHRDSSQKAFATLQARFTESMTELGVATRNLESAKADLKTSTRAREEAERIQKALQTEGEGLMRSLDEMRPKIVDLTQLKLEQGEKVDQLERLVSTLEGTISQLESDAEDARETYEQAEKDWTSKLAQREKDHTLAQGASTDLQKAYSELQEELASALASLRTLETERSKYHQEASRRLDEVDRLTALTKSQTTETSGLRQEVTELRRAQDEETGFLARAQNEIETLRQELASRDEELDRLRVMATTPISSAPRSLDDEMIGSLKQQHMLELSTLQATIRDLNTSLFDAEARTHALQKQNNTLAEQLSHRPIPHRSSSPIPRPSSRTGTRERSGLAAPPLSRSVFDHNLSPAMRHKREVSLSMLKARIESEAAAAADGGSRPGSPELHHSHPSRPQILLDESHIFWCHSCRGDLVIL